MKKQLTKKELSKIIGGANLSKIDEFRQTSLNIVHAQYLRIVEGANNPKLRHPKGWTVEEMVENGLRMIMNGDKFGFTREEIISGKVIPIIQ